MAEGEDRTEAATPRRLERARSEGSVAVSREVPALAGLGAATLVLSMFGSSIGHGMSNRLVAMFDIAAPRDLGAAMVQAAIAIAMVAAPLVLGVVVASVAASLLQTGFVLRPTALMPDLLRLNPTRGLKRLFGIAGLVEAVKSVVKLGVLGFAAFHVMAGGVAALGSAALWMPDQLAERIMREVLQLAMTLLGAQVVIAGADVWWVRHKHARDLRMSKEDLRQEAKEADGNPQIKQRLRQIRLSRARKRMMAAVPTATVVVTNPTHYAIALVYDREKGGAPRVVAKGVDEVAARIREVAREHRVPLVANPPLARALYKVELDAEIPAEHFKVVAEVIAYVWRLRGRARR